MDFVRGRQAGAEARDLDDDRAHVVVDCRRLERIAEMVEALRPATHDLIERRVGDVLFDRTRQPDYQDGVMRDLRGSDEGKVKRRDHRDRDSDGGDSGLQIAGRANPAPMENKIATIIPSRTSRLIHNRSENGFFIR